jgi:ATP-dependent Zn protease
MQKNLSGRGLKAALGPVLPVIVAVLLLQILFGGSLRTATTTTMTYTEFKTALRSGQIQTATIGIEQISGKLADDKLYQTVRVDDPDLLKDLEANKVTATGQVAGNGHEPQPASSAA